jgi:hypothetical protein
MAFIVDGPTEEKSLKDKFQKDFNCVPQFRYGPGNGRSYPILGLAKGLAPILVGIFRTNVKIVFIIPDFERRKESIDKFAKDLKTAVITETAAKLNKSDTDLNEKIIVIPSNIMFENWILADIDGLKTTGLINENAVQLDYEGKHGSAELKQIMTSKNYKKTVHASILFKKIRNEIARNNSVSYSHLLDNLSDLINS